MMTMINKKTSKRVVASIGKIGINMIILCYLIDIDARIKIMIPRI